MRCILASAIFTTISRQVPAEVAKQLAEFKKITTEQLRTAKANSDRFTTEAQGYREQVRNLYFSFITEQHMNKVVDAGLKAFDRRVALYFNEFSLRETNAYKARVDAVRESFNQLERQSRDAVRTFSDLEPTFRKEVSKLVLNAETLRELTTKDVATSINSAWHQRSLVLIATTIVATAIVIFTSLKLVLRRADSAGCLP